MLGFSGLYSVLLGCTAPCSGSESGLVNVVQHCCISSEREAVHELVEQQRVIGDPVTVEEEAWLAWSTPRLLNAHGCRQKMLVRPEKTRSFEQLYVLDQQLGEGSFGNVYKAYARSASGAQRPVAVKVFTLNPIAQEPAAKVEGQESRQKLASFFSECAPSLYIAYT